jgi:putative transposase
MNRGARHQQVFWNDNSCSLFLKLLGEAVARYGIVIHAYVLMPNHFHLLVESVRANLSKAMQNLQFRYSQEVNRAPGFDGALFRGRFKNKLVLDEAHWFYLLMYLHLNPVRARLVMHPDQFIWSSHSAYDRDKMRPSWLTTNQMQEYFNTEGGYSACLEATMNGSWPMPTDFDSVLFESRRGARQHLVKQPEVSTAVSIESALKQVAVLSSAKKSEILSTKRGIGGNSARVLAIWWLVYGAGQTNSEIGRIMKISPSAVSKILKRIRSASRQYFGGKLAAWQKELVDKYQ